MPLPNPPFQNDVAKCAFAAFPTIARDGLLEIRHLNFAVAEAENVGAFEESLKCGQPAYLTSERKLPTPPLRLGVPKIGGYALFVHCQWPLIADARTVFDDAFTYEGNRAVLFDVHAQITKTPLPLLIAQA